MLTSWHNPLVCRWFDWYCASSLRRHFYAVRGYGDGPTPAAAGPRLVVAATHQSFWDGLVLNWWLKSLGWRDLWCVSAAEQVRRHPFFRRVGSCGVERGDPADGLRVVRFTASRLRRASPARPAALVVFPQGRIVHPSLAVEVEAGAGLIARAAAAPVLPLALHYDFWEEQRPELLIAPGTAEGLSRTSRKKVADGLQADLVGLREKLFQVSSANVPGSLLLQGRRSIKDLGRRTPGRA